MILHVDMDAFYASVEERDQPEIAGRPLIVGGSAESRGVVAAANYPAREFGVHSAMATSKALRLCPDAVVLPPRMEWYSRIARQIREIFHRYTPEIEPLSLDEAFLDATGSVQLFGSVEEIGRKIKQDIWSELRLIASVGVAPNKFLAKLASDMDKPDGFTVITADVIQETLDPLPVTRIWGVGRVTAQKFHALGIHTISDLRQKSLEQLGKQFGSHGKHFWQLARGIDDRMVVPDRKAKSVSHETTFPTDIEDPDQLRAWLLELTEQVARRLRNSNLVARLIQLKVRYDNFDTITRSKRLEQATSSTQSIWQTAIQLFEHKLPKRHLRVRLLGVGAGLLSSADSSSSLFPEEESSTDPKSDRLDSVADSIRSRFGSSALKRGSIMQHGVEHRSQTRVENLKDDHGQDQATTE